MGKIINYKDMRKSVSLKDIAQALSLSTTAVSKALRNSADISEKTKKRVIKKAEELGYIPNSIALSLKRGTTKRIAVVINDLHNPFFAAISDRIFRAILKRGYEPDFVYASKHMLVLEDANKLLINKYCAVMSLVEPIMEIGELFHKHGVPFVLIGINSSNPLISSMYTDDYLGGKLIGKYFIENNFNNALYLTNSFSETSYRRYNGFSDILLKHKKTVDIMPFSGISDEEIMVTSLRKIKANKYDLVFCFSDYLAILLKRALQESNYTKDIVVFGYDNLNQYSRIIEKTNSVFSNYDEIIDDAIKLVFRQIKNGVSKTSVNKIYPVQIIFGK